MSFLGVKQNFGRPPVTVAPPVPVQHVVRPPTIHDHIARALNVQARRAARI